MEQTGKLTRAEKRALLAIKEGADITGYALAKTLRQIAAKAPAFIDIGPAMREYSIHEHRAYFGAIATKAGLCAARVK